MNDHIEMILRQLAKELFNLPLESLNAAERKVVRAEMWNRFYFILQAARSRTINNSEHPNGYAVLNGQLYPRNRLMYVNGMDYTFKTLLLITDGMVPWNAMKGMSDEQVARQVMATYKEGGLQKVLNVARGIEARVANVNYIDNAEATGIAIEF
jgi:hypothetical protein